MLIGDQIQDGASVDGVPVLGVQVEDDQVAVGQVEMLLGVWKQSFSFSLTFLESNYAYQAAQLGIDFFK